MKDLREEEADAIQRALCDQKLSETNMKKTDKAVEINNIWEFEDNFQNYEKICVELPSKLELYVQRHRD